MILIISENTYLGKIGALCIAQITWSSDPLYESIIQIQTYRFPSMHKKALAWSASSGALNRFRRDEGKI